MNLGSKSVTGLSLVVAGSLLYLPAMVPDTGWLGYLAALPATLALIYGTLLVGQDADGNAV